MRFLALHVKLLLRTVHLQLARLLDHFLGHLLERALILVDDLEDVELRVVLVACVSQVILCIQRVTAVRLQRTIENVIVAAERVIVIHFRLAFFGLQIAGAILLILVAVIIVII